MKKLLQPISKRYVLYIGRSLLPSENHFFTVGISREDIVRCREHNKIMTAFIRYRLPVRINTGKKAEKFETKMRKKLDLYGIFPKAYPEFCATEFKPLNCQTTGRTHVWFSVVAREEDFLKMIDDYMRKIK